jgi:hypothetical protein
MGIFGQTLLGFYSIIAGQDYNLFAMAFAFTMLFVIIYLLIYLIR